MFSKINRFHGNQAVRRVYKLGKSIRCRTMSLHYSQSEARQNNTKVGVVVSRKVNKSAVVRNRIRRRVYEQLRSKLVNIEFNGDILVTVYKTELADMPAQQLAIEVDNLLSKLPESPKRV